MKNKNHIEKFLSLVNQTTKPIVCYSSGGTSAMYKASLSGVLLENGRGKDAYFYVNQGGTKQEEIKYLTACFVDIDAGRDKNKKYLKPSLVTSKKKKILGAINAFKIKPNIIVETRNGYQVYWLIKKLPNSVTNRNLWKATQTKLNNAFRHVGADSKVMKINQIMRLPYTTWFKRHEGKTPYNVKCCIKHTKRYDLKTLSNIKESTFIQKDGRQTYNSYKRVASQRPSQQSYPTTQENAGSLKEFLKDVAQILFLKKMYFMSKTAWTYYNNM